MLILNGIVGICLLVGGVRHREQVFGTRGVSSSLAVLAALAVLTMILPNYTTSVADPYYSPAQLLSVAAVSLAAVVLLATLSLSTGRTTVLQGAVHLVILAVYLVTTVIS